MFQAAVTKLHTCTLLLETRCWPLLQNEPQLLDTLMCSVLAILSLSMPMQSDEEGVVVLVLRIRIQVSFALLSFRFDRVSHIYRDTPSSSPLAILVPVQFPPISIRPIKLRSCLTTKCVSSSSSVTLAIYAASATLPSTRTTATLPHADRLQKLPRIC